MGIDINATEYSLRNTFKNFSIKGLDDSVNIYRDFYGIPHVLAKTINRSALAPSITKVFFIPVG